MTTKAHPNQHRNLQAQASEDASLAACASKIVEHLERNIIQNRHNSATANRLACMNKYIQLMYLSTGKMEY